MNRRGFLMGGLSLAGAAAFVGFAPPHRLKVAAQIISGHAAQPPESGADLVEAEPWAGKLIAAAESQIGETVRYDPAYVGLEYPMGDIPRERGVCTDVVIRAYRDAFGLDLQRLVHEDMKRAFSAYPKIWGLKRPDRNIDHRRVPNLERFLKRQNAALPVSDDPSQYLPGDIITQRLPGNLPHIAIVTNRPVPGKNRPLIVHNIGAGTRLEDRLFDFTLNGHFRFRPKTA